MGDLERVHTGRTQYEKIEGLAHFVIGAARDAIVVIQNRQILDVAIAGNDDVMLKDKGIVCDNRGIISRVRWNGACHNDTQCALDRSKVR